MSLRPPMIDYLSIADRSWPVLNRVMGAHAIVYRATGGRLGRRLKVRAEEADAGARRRLWPKSVAYNPHWGNYEQRTTRTIPVVILRPQPAERRASRAV
jgi:F420H(2)-dependent quinone reductase